MKTQIILFVLILGAFSCRKDEMNPYWGEAFANKNGVAWEAKPTAAFAPAFPDGFVGIQSDVYNNQGFKRESLSFLKVPLKKGVYPLGVQVYPHNYSYVAASYATLPMMATSTVISITWTQLPLTTILRY